MRILVDITPCEWRSLWIYACRILRVWKSNNQADIPIRLLIKANMKITLNRSFQSLNILFSDLTNIAISFSNYSNTNVF